MKNIVVFSDGTGQAGGLRPDQRLSNIYKLYRASRNGPDSPIDPGKQIAFYDSGLGSEEISGPWWSQPLSFMRKLFGSAFGTGLTRNVADCYEFILSVYQPGDRIFLFGFSRGAYTVRSLAGVMNLCGVPVVDADGKSIPRAGKALRRIAEEAVHTVYEHGAGHPRAKYEDEREEQARRFRNKYSTQNSEKNERGDIVPYFIGVFDTVAALGSTGIKRVGLIALIGLIATVAALGVGAVISWLFGLSLLAAGLATLIIFLVGYGIFSYRSRVRVIYDFPNRGDVRHHWTGWRFAHYDKFLDKRVRYARHAQAIDEKRASFARVGWGLQADHAERPADWLVQVWFAGNHSDIGGSYAETESRLSDIALEWMVDQATGIPDPLIIDTSKLNMFGDPLAPMHCEVESLRDIYPTWWPRKWRRSWNAAIRDRAVLSSCHPTVRQRLDAPAEAFRNGSIYRPEALRSDPDASKYFSTGAGS